MDNATVGIFGQILCGDAIISVSAFFVLLIRPLSHPTERGFLYQNIKHIFVTAIGTAMAMFLNVFEFEAFLYFIGSVFAPMIAIQIVDYFILKKDSSTVYFDFTSLVIWLVGFVLYRLFMRTDMAVGCTLPAMLVVGLLHAIVQKIKKAGR